MSNYVTQDGELYHAGVKGMKWGVRKAQKSGSGKKRLGVSRFRLNRDTGAMYRMGVPGGAKDKLRKGKGTEFYNKLKAKRGKEYADTIVKRAKTKNTKTYIKASAIAIAVGSSAVMKMLKNQSSSSGPDIQALMPRD